MVGCAEINVAIRRAIIQYGRANVTVTGPFLKLLFAHTFHDPDKCIEHSRTAYLAPLENESTVITPENAQWALPNQKNTEMLYTCKLRALNRARQQLGLDPVPHNITRKAFKSNPRKRMIALAIARYFFMRRHNLIGAKTENKQLTAKDIYKALEAVA